MRSSIFSFALLLAFAAVLPADAATLASSGTIDVPSNTRVLVIATDPVLQQVLSDDFSVARHSKSSGGPKMLTLTVAFTQRVLQPGISVMDLAPGVPGVAKLVKAAGYSLPEDSNEPLTGDAAAYVAQGHPSTGVYGNNPNSGSPYQTNPITGQFSGYSPSPPTAPDPRDPLNRAIEPPDYLKPHPESLYDSALIAHAVLSDGKGEMTVVAVMHPNEDLRTVKKELAERIANAVLH